MSKTVLRTYTIEKGFSAHLMHGRRYTEGDAITSAMPLDKLFGRKFRLAPAGVVDENWPSDVLDMIVDGEYSVIPNNNQVSFRIVGPNSKTVKGCESLSRAKAFDKYRELVGDSGKNDEVKTPKTKTPVATVEDDEDESGDEDEPQKKSKKDKDEDDESDEDEDESKDDEDESDDEDDEDDKPSKKNKKNKKNRR